MRSLSYTFIWQPYVSMKRRFGSGRFCSGISCSQEAFLGALALSSSGTPYNSSR